MHGIDGLHPALASWMRERHGSLAPAQVAAQGPLSRGENLLLVSPTASGKTLAAFLPILSRLAERADAGLLEEGVHCLYVSPLRALNHDVAENLRGPIEGMDAHAARLGMSPPRLRVGVRTGDTSQAQRRQQSENPPHVLVTTPESLALALASPRLLRHLGAVSCVVVDEVHALAADKRGAHLALSLERLARHLRRLGRPEFMRVGLSATVERLADVARFLCGARPCHVAHVDDPRPLELHVVTPVADMARATPEAHMAGVLDRIHEVVQAHRATLVFAQTRRAAERLVTGLRDRHGADYALGDVEATHDPAHAAPTGSDLSDVAPHHGSMSREKRLVIESRLKRGEARAVVTTASLELGLDVGDVEAVVLVGACGSVSRTLQRVGRSGRGAGTSRKGWLVALDPNDLIACHALVEEAKAGRLEPLATCGAPLDVLAQHVCGLVLDRPTDLEDARATFAAAGPFLELNSQTLGHVVDELSTEGLVRREGDLVARGPTLTRRSFLTNVGTIPTPRRVRVFDGDHHVGEMEARFADGLPPGEVFQLGGETWRVVRQSPGTLRVAPARGRLSTVPSWASEGVGMAHALAHATGIWRHQRARSFHAQANKGSHEEPLTKSQVRAWCLFQSLVSGPWSADQVPVERHRDDERRHVTVVHSTLGRGGNRVLLDALLTTLEGDACARGHAGDLGFVVWSSAGHAPTRSGLQALAHVDLAEVLARTLPRSPLFARRFAQVAETFLLERTPEARRMAPWHRRRMHEARGSASIVWQAALDEARAGAYDIAAATAFQDDLRAGRLRFGPVVQTRAPSPFALGLLPRAGGPPPCREAVEALREGVERLVDALALARTG